MGMGEDRANLLIPKLSGRTGESGLSMIEVMIAGAVALVLFLGTVSMQVYQSRGNRTAASQSANTTLAQAIRTQLARKASCVPSFVVQPTNWSGANAVVVNVGTPVTPDVVQAGADKKTWGLHIDSLQVRGLTQFGTNSAGNRIYVGDLMLKASTFEMDPTKRVSFKEVKAAHLTFEVNGANTLISCFSSDSTTEVTENLEAVCQMTASPDGTPGVWDAATGKCVVADRSPQSTCAVMGGSWNGTACSFTSGPQGVCESLGGTWNGSQCAMSVQASCTQIGGTMVNGNCKLPQPKCNGGDITDTSPERPSGEYSHGQTVSWTPYSGYCGSGYTSDKTCNATCVSGVWIDVSCTGCTALPTPSCFTGKALVLLSSGESVPIERVRVGDVIRVPEGSDRVVAVEIHELGERPLVGINGSTPFFTPEHPFLSERGWVSMRPRAAASEHGFDGYLQWAAGESLRRIDGVEIVRTLDFEKPEASQPVYNLVLERGNAYVMNGYVVHNKYPQPTRGRK